MNFDTYKDKRVFVTGHTGFKGSWLCEWLLALGAKVYGFSNGIPTKPSLFGQLRLARRIRAFESRGRPKTDVENPDTTSKDKMRTKG